MTSAASRVPDVLDWLLANLPDITDVQTIEGPPTQKAKRERIELWGGDIVQEYRAGSARTPGGPIKSETGTIDLGIVSLLPGKTPSDARKRVFAINDLIAAHLVSNPRATLNLGGLVCWALLTPMKWVYMAGDNAQGCVLHSQLLVTTPTL